MLDWSKSRGRRHNNGPTFGLRAFAPRGHVMSGEYLALYTYLHDRYANTVVLTFSEIEGLLGFKLPDEARLHAGWWTDAGPKTVRPRYGDSWRLAGRSAMPNMSAHTVVFERVAAP